MTSIAFLKHQFVPAAAVILLFLPLIGSVACCDEAQVATKEGPEIQLELVRALHVEGVRDPSGLTIHNGILYSVSDKVDDTIWRVELGEKQAVFREHLKFRCDELAGQPLDLEGISTDRAGEFYLLSETRFVVIRVGPSGKTSIVDTIEEVGKRSGLFAKAGAGPEGLACLDRRRFLVAAEREPMGLIEINTDRSPRIRVLSDSGPILLRDGRPADITGIHTFRDEIWCLTRNAESIFRVELSKDHQWQQRDASSFAHVVNKPEFAYRDMRFGHAEGLAVDERFFYVILDNNDVPRQADPNDRRPLLLVFRRPRSSQNGTGSSGE